MKNNYNEINIMPTNKNGRDWAGSGESPVTMLCECRIEYSSYKKEERFVISWITINFEPADLIRSFIS
jgi:hypothetical protein